MYNALSPFFGRVRDDELRVVAGASDERPVTGPRSRRGIAGVVTERLS